MIESERHNRYQGAQDKAWSLIRQAEDYAAADRGEVDASYQDTVDRAFARAQAWATVAIALRRDGPS